MFLHALVSQLRSHDAPTVTCRFRLPDAGYAEVLRTVIEPVPETVEAMLHKVFSRSEIEPGIDCTHSLANCPVSDTWWY